MDDAGRITTGHGPDVTHELVRVCLKVKNVAVWRMSAGSCF